MNFSNFTFKNDSKNLQDIYLHGLSESDVFRILNQISENSGDYRQLASKLFLSPEVTEEHKYEAIRKALISLKEKGTSKDMAFSGRGKKITEKGKYVVAGDLYAFYLTALRNLCIDQKKEDGAQRRGGGAVVHYGIINATIDFDNEFRGLVSEVTLADQERYFQGNDVVEANDLYSEFFQEVADREIDLELQEFMRLTLEGEASRKEIIDQMGINYPKYNKLEKQMKVLGSEILKGLNVA